MADIFSASNTYQGTFVPGAVEPTEIFQICAIANINASNQFESTFWVNKNGSRVDSNLGNASWRVKDKTGAVVTGLSSVSLAPDVDGYYKTVAASAQGIYDLTHYVMEIEIPVDGVGIESSIGLVVGE